MPKLCHLLDNKGATLTEFLIAMLILGVGLLGLVTVFGRVISNNAHSKQITTATVLAQQRMEGLKRRSIISSTSFGNITTVSAKPVPGNTSFYISTVVVNGPVTGTKDTTVTVTWDSGARNVALRTILTSP